MPQMSPLMWLVFPFMMMIVVMFFTVTLWKEELSMKVSGDKEGWMNSSLKW